MAELFPILLISLLVLYVLFIVWLIRSGRLEKWNLSLMLGVVLMQRTQRGKKAIDFIARPRRFWNFIGDAGIVLTLGGMVAITGFFLWTVVLALNPNSGVPALGIKEIFVIPGVNPFVPLWYGLAALAITLIVHEGGHGVLARANGMKLKSLGLLWFVVPIGAFVEPEELDLKVAPRRARLRVFGAGPAVNVAFAAVALMGFALMMGSLTPQSGAWIGGVSQDALGHDLPAKAAGIAGGDIIVSADGQAIVDNAGLTTFLNHSKPGQTVAFGLRRGETVHITLTSLWQSLSEAEQFNVTSQTAQGRAICQYYFEPDPPAGTCGERMVNKAFMGVSSASDRALAFTRDPLGAGGKNLGLLAALPIAEVLYQQPYLTVYMPSFYTTPFEHVAFWILANLLFWVFWINLMVGVTNILPMMPLDGGHIFREAVGGAVAKLNPRMPAERRDRVVGVVATAMTFLILGAFIIQIVAPHIVRGLR